MCGCPDTHCLFYVRRATPSRRLTKEEKSYVKEAQDQETRVAKFESEGKEEWEVKKQVCVGEVWIYIYKSASAVTLQVVHASSRWHAHIHLSSS